MTRPKLYIALKTKIVFIPADVARLVITHKDRLLRFGAELVFAICEEFETEVVIVNKSSHEVSFEQELVQDMIELITVFSARLYGARSKKNKKLIDGIATAVNKALHE
jgi:predicted site-specific integrase-resolvase